MAGIAGRTYRVAGRAFALPDLLLAGAGVLMLAASLLPWYGYDAPGWHPTHYAFQSGFKAFFAVWLVVLIAGAAGTRAWTGTGLTRVGVTSLTWNALFLIGDAIAGLLIVLFWMTLPGLDGATTGAKFGAFGGLFCVLLQAAGAVLGLASAGRRIRMELVVGRLRRLRRRPASG